MLIYYLESLFMAFLNLFFI